MVGSIPPDPQLDKDYWQAQQLAHQHSGRRGPAFAANTQSSAVPSAALARLASKKTCSDQKEALPLDERAWTSASWSMEAEVVQKWKVMKLGGRCAIQDGIFVHFHESFLPETDAIQID